MIIKNLLFTLKVEASDAIVIIKPKIQDEINPSRSTEVGRWHSVFTLHLIFRLRSVMQIFVKALAVASSVTTEKELRLEFLIKEGICPKEQRFIFVNKQFK